MHRNEVPEDQFFDGRLDDPLLHIVAISCPSYKHGGGDPSELNAFHLSIIGPLLAARASQHPSFKVAVFLDKSCLAAIVPRINYDLWKMDSADNCDNGSCGCWVASPQGACARGARLRYVVSPRACCRH